MPTVQGNSALPTVCLGREMSEALGLFLLMILFTLEKDWSLLHYPISSCVAAADFSAAGFTGLLNSFVSLPYLTIKIFLDENP